MKLWFIFAFLICLPTLYVLYFEHSQAEFHRGPEKYQGATVFDVWMNHDRQGFMAFREQYLGRAAEWEQNVKPHLEKRVLPYVVIGPIIYLIWTFLMWLFGRGPFRQKDEDYTFRARQTSSRFARPHVENEPHTLKYRRK